MSSAVSLRGKRGYQALPRLHATHKHGGGTKEEIRAITWRMINITDAKWQLRSIQMQV